MPRAVSSPLLTQTANSERSKLDKQKLPVGLSAVDRKQSKRAARSQRQGQQDNLTGTCCTRLIYNWGTRTLTVPCSWSVNQFDPGAAAVAFKRVAE